MIYTTVVELPHFSLESGSRANTIRVWKGPYPEDDQPLIDDDHLPEGFPLPELAAIPRWPDSRRDDIVATTS